MDIVRIKLLSVALLMVLFMGAAHYASAATEEELENDSREALQELVAIQPVAANLSEAAVAILVFPDIVQAGFVFGGSYGEGVMIKDSMVMDYYNSVSGSWGLQFGAQSYGYAVFLMTDEAVNYIEETQGWEVGVGPTVVLVDDGVAQNISTTSIQQDAYAFIFSQQGLMAGITFEGTKISRINP